MNKNLLIGTWTLVSCIGKSSEGEECYPCGHNPAGLLTYTSDGYVFVSRMTKALLDARGDLVPGSIEEAKAVAAGFEAYSGTYTVSGNMVTHNIELCSSPIFCGTKQNRFFELHNNELSLTTQPVVVDGITHSALLVWRKEMP